MKELKIYILSDGGGENINNLIKFVLDNFENNTAKLIDYSYISDIDELENIFETISPKNSLIIHSFLNINFSIRVKNFSGINHITEIDFLNPLMDIIEKKFNVCPSRNSGLYRKLDEQYFKRISAIEFAVKYDDGSNPRGILKADLVLVGISRTSKTPLSIYLANQNKIKVTNVPLVPEIKVPEELFKISPKKIIGLTNSIEKLNSIREDRVETIGFSNGESYTSIHRIIDELEYAEKIMRRLSCPIIDVSNKSIEETATVVMNIINENKL